MALFYNKNGKLIPITSNAVNINTEEIKKDLIDIKSKIPSTTNSTDNQLVNQTYVKDALLNVHTHDNKRVLDKISEDTTKDRLKFNDRVYLAEEDVPETAIKAIGDSEGNKIVDTYETKVNAANKLNISGDNGTEAGVSALINKLDVGEVTPGDETYYISQAIGNSAFCKRPLKALWEYIKNKLSSTFGIGGTKTDNAIVRFDGTTGKIQNTGITIDDSNNINMITFGMTGTSNKIVFNGSTDGADIYYQATASDQGNLVLNTRDDATSYIRFANNGNFNSYISTNDGIYHGNIDNGKIYTKNDTVSINSNTLNRNALYITGNTYGNNTTDVKTAGKLSFGDAGPQIIFCMEKEIGSNSQPLALIYTDNDAIRPGVSLHLVSNQSEAWFVSHSIQALSRLRIPTSAPSNPQNGDIWIS